jgi:hypothetical protein
MASKPNFPALVSAGSLLMIAALTPAWAVPAGTVEFAVGDVRVRSAAGVERRVAKGATVEVGESVLTGAQGQAQMRMIDNAFLAVRPDSEINISEYTYAGKADGKENALLRLVKGTLRTFTGAITASRKERFLTVTPTATIGVRGSGNVAFYSPNLGTLNHTIEGSHAVASVNAQGGVIGSVITTPGQTVQVMQGQPPVRIPTPQFLLQAASSQPAPGGQGQKPAPQGGGGGGGGGGTSDSGQQGGGSDQATTSGGGESGGARTSAGADTALTGDVTPTLFGTTPATLTTARTTTITGSTGSADLNLSSGTQTSGGISVPLTSSLVVQPPLSALGRFVLLNFPGQFRSSTFAPTTGGVSASAVSPFNPASFGFFNNVQSFDAIGSEVVFTGPNGNFLSGQDIQGDFKYAFTLSGDLSGASEVTTLANGISFGRYASRNPAGGGPALMADSSFIASMVGTSSSTPPVTGTATSSHYVIANLPWIQGPGIWPIFISHVLTGTATYSGFAGTPPVDINGVAGTLNSASLSVNFDRQFVNTTIDVTTPGNHWVATGNNLGLRQDGQFFATLSSTAPLTHDTLSLSLNGTTLTSTTGSGVIDGQLTGPLLSGGILSYWFSSGPGNIRPEVNGVVGFSDPVFSAGAPSATTPFQLRLAARGFNSGIDGTTGNVAANGGAANYFPNEYVTRTAITALDPSRLKFDAQGALIEYDVSVPVVGNLSSSFGTTVPEAPMRVSLVAGGSPASGSLPAMPAITGTPAVVAEFGSDAVTGITWGRYSNGSTSLVDRVTGNVVSTSNTPGPINHYILSPVQAGPTTLPTTGTVAYTWVGGTQPTDTVGNIGTLNSATLNANFSAKTVDASVNLTVGPRTWTASATALPIIAGVGFEGQKPIGGVPGTLTVGCSGTGCVPTALSGRLTGGFTGTTGQGAGIAYSLNSGFQSGTVPGIGVGGVAAFRR